MASINDLATAAIASSSSPPPLSQAQTQTPAKAQSAGGPSRGAFVVLEGLDRSGKTTQVKLLEQRFVEAGRPVKVMRFPGTLRSPLCPLPQVDEFLATLFSLPVPVKGGRIECSEANGVTPTCYGNAEESKPAWVDRSTPIGQMIDAYLKSDVAMEDHVIHLLFSANRWEAAHVLIITTSCDLLFILAPRYSLISFYTPFVRPHGLPRKSQKEPAFSPLSPSPETPDPNLLVESQRLTDHARAQRPSAQISSLLASGTTILCDRFHLSGIAYSAAKRNPSLPLSWAAAPEKGLPRPDLVLFLDLDERAARARGGFGDERYEREAMQARVRDIFRGMAADADAGSSSSSLAAPEPAEPTPRGRGENIVVVDAGSSVEDVADEIWRRVEARVRQVDGGELGASVGVVE
ncbi:hypothetical protein Purlil1_5252 [Purpureocillium lilacinum]|uniref:dTMP kinase n=1 Tax=Purpureocillium lilacinum TaxID=33203 RepID=A0ABR0C331_PURLI|nr:hypothetical protein Purlil1_5252 [Purpureocillium lilacinum]